MAALATEFSPTDVEMPPAWGGPRGSGKEHTEDYRQRLIPYEDVYFFSKRIDNSRLVRQADPHARKKCWKAIRVSSLGALVVMALLLPSMLGMIAGFQIHALEQERGRMVNERVALELDETRLLSPQRLEEVARTMQLVDPAPSQVQFVNPKADGSLALNVPPK
jgi:hypothetical protein